MPRIGYSCSHPRRKANSGNKGHRRKWGYHLKENLCCTGLSRAVLLSILKSKPIALGWRNSHCIPLLQPPHLCLKIKKAAAVQPSVCMRTEPVEGSCHMGKLLSEDAWKINNGTSAQCEVVTWVWKRRRKGETMCAWDRQEPAFPSSWMAKSSFPCTYQTWDSISRKGSLAEGDAACSVVPQG